MQYSSPNKHTTRLSSGFTLVEVLVISPVVILAIGGFIALMVTMVGDVLASRDQNMMIYEGQEALNLIENDIKLSVQFLATTGTLSSPQGSDLNATGTNAFTSTMTNTLILHTLSTDKNPADSTRQIVYYRQTQPQPCNDQRIYNKPFLIKRIYFIKNNSLWQRTVMPTYNLNATSDSATLCVAPWQKDTCSPGYSTATRCQTNDSELMKNITSLSVEYFTTPDSFTNIGATNATQASTVKVTVNGNKTSAGRPVTTNMSARATRINAVILP